LKPVGRCCSSVKVGGPNNANLSPIHFTQPSTQPLTESLLVFFRSQIHSYAYHLVFTRILSMRGILRHPPRVKEQRSLGSRLKNGNRIAHPAETVKGCAKFLRRRGSALNGHSNGKKSAARLCGCRGFAISPDCNKLYRFNQRSVLSLYAELTRFKRTTALSPDARLNMP